MKEVSLTFQWKRMDDAWGRYYPIEDGVPVTLIELESRACQKTKIDSFFHELTHFLVDVEACQRQHRGEKAIKIHGQTEERICRMVARAAAKAYFEELERAGFKL